MFGTSEIKFVTLEIKFGSALSASAIEKMLIARVSELQECKDCGRIKRLRWQPIGTDPLQRSQSSYKGFSF